MKPDSTTLLRIAVFLIGIPVLALCIFWLPRVAFGITENSTWLEFLQYTIVVGLYLAAVPFFVALHQALKLLDYIDKNEAFSRLSLKALKHIKHCAMIISALFVVGTASSYPIAQQEDAPGLTLMGFIITFASFVIAIFAAVLQRLVQNAVEIKSENDLTI